MNNRRPDAVICMTDPPFLGGLRVRSRAPLSRAASSSISQDVFPEIAVELGRLRNPIGVLRGLVGAYLRRADRDRRDRRDDAASGCEAEGRADRAAPRDPELGRHPRQQYED